MRVAHIILRNPSLAQRQVPNDPICVPQSCVCVFTVVPYFVLPLPQSKRCSKQWSSRPQNEGLSKNTLEESQKIELTGKKKKVFKTHKRSQSFQGGKKISANSHRSYHCQRRKCEMRV
jgi:hypothetical protein